MLLTYKLFQNAISIWKEASTQVLTMWKKRRGKQIFTKSKVRAIPNNRVQSLGGNWSKSHGRWRRLTFLQEPKEA